MITQQQLQTKEAFLCARACVPGQVCAQGTLAPDRAGPSVALRNVTIIARSPGRPYNLTFVLILLSLQSEAAELTFTGEAGQERRGQDRIGLDGIGERGGGGRNRRTGIGLEMHVIWCRRVCVPLWLRPQFVALSLARSPAPPDGGCDRSGAACAPTRSGALPSARCADKLARLPPALCSIVPHLVLLARSWGPALRRHSLHRQRAKPTKAKKEFNRSHC